MHVAEVPTCVYCLGELQELVHLSHIRFHVDLATLC